MHCHNWSSKCDKTSDCRLNFSILVSKSLPNITALLIETTSNCHYLKTFILFCSSLTSYRWGYSLWVGTISTWILRGGCLTSLLPAQCQGLPLPIPSAATSIRFCWSRNTHGEKLGLSCKFIGCPYQDVDTFFFKSAKCEAIACKTRNIIRINQACVSVIPGHSYIQNFPMLLNTPNKVELGPLKKSLGNIQSQKSIQHSPKQILNITQLLLFSEGYLT